MELSGPVAVQHHGHLTLTLDFQDQISKMLSQKWEDRLTWKEKLVSQ